MDNVWTEDSDGPANTKDLPLVPDSTHPGANDVQTPGHTGFHQADREARLMKQPRLVVYHSVLARRDSRAVLRVED
jgi:hypothetical protein